MGGKWSILGSAYTSIVGLFRKPRSVYTGEDLVHPDFNRPWNYRAVIFQGGGPNGIVYGGTLKVLEDAGIRKSLTHFAGTSIGSVFAALAAVGAPAENVLQDIMNTDFSRFSADPLFLNYATIPSRWGLYNGAIFENWVADLLDRYTGDRNITLQGVWDKYGSELVIPTCSLDGLSTHYQCRTSDPELRVCDAIRYSTTIPLAFQAVSDRDGNYCIDGGFGDNYPLDVFDTVVDPLSVVGFKNMTADQTEDNIIIHKLPFTITNMVSYVTAVLYMASVFADRNKILLMKPNTYWERTIRLLSPNKQLTDFNITDDEKKNYIEIGYRGTVDQLTHMINYGCYRS